MGRSPESRIAAATRETPCTFAAAWPRSTRSPFATPPAQGPWLRRVRSFRCATSLWRIATWPAWSRRRWPRCGGPRCLSATREARRSRCPARQRCRWTCSARSTTRRERCGPNAEAEPAWFSRGSRETRSGGPAAVAPRAPPHRRAEPDRFPEAGCRSELASDSESTAEPEPDGEREPDVESEPEAASEPGAEREPDAESELDI